MMFRTVAFALLLCTLDGSALAQSIPTVPQPDPGVNLSGSWASVVQSGVQYTLTLTQDAAGNVTGSYNAGSIGGGVVVGHELFARWTQASFTGTLDLRFSPDATSFAGIWAQGDVLPGPTTPGGTWDGYRPDVLTATAPTSAFAGPWSLAQGAQPAMINLAANGDVLTATYAGMSGQPAALTVGPLAASAPGTAVVGANPSLSGIPLNWTDATITGSGMIFASVDGTRLSGFWHASDRSFGAWSLSRPGSDSAAGGPGSQTVGGPGSEGTAGVTGPVVGGPGTAAAPGAMPAQAAATVAGPEGVAVLPPAQVREPAVQPEAVPVAPPAAAATPAIPVAPMSTAAPPAPTVRIKLPIGACPMPTAAVTTQLNVHDGEGGTVLPPPIPNGTQVQCVACDKSWCLIADSNPHATVARTYLDFGVDGSPTAASSGEAPPPADTNMPAADFNGPWVVSDDARDTDFEFDIRQTGDRAKGTFFDRKGNTGSFKGTIDGTILKFDWTESDGESGNGSLKLTPDGQSAAGSYHAKTGGPMGKWLADRGKLQMGGTTTRVPDEASPSFAGNWQVRSDKDWHYQFTFTQNGASVKGSFVDQIGQHGQLTGTVTGNVYVYHWTEDGGYAGTGTFKLSTDGKSIDGGYAVDTYPPNTATYLLKGTWAGTSGGAGSAATATPPAKQAGGAPDPVDYGGCAC